MPTLTLAGTMSFPLGGEATPPTRPFSAQLVYTERQVNDVTLEGGEEGSVDLMGQMGEAKACYIEVISGGCDLLINGAEETIPVSEDGGFWVWFNPNGGLTDLQAAAEALTKLRVYLFS